jgi:hypothetical protein
LSVRALVVRDEARVHIRRAAAARSISRVSSFISVAVAATTAIIAAAATVSVR